ncbi:AraC family transcriptional regulator [Chryseobacterium jejuense]|uniref:AraC-type DNA-binding protein n=1 Tax=Chryseobacterium jejuense TaxID=445960 RepID=A0A2X2V8R3_CHRJE|nr:AraC family transcriptional regulator [Chryseobacterium jejuense]SDI95767.1 AraC-type DNA-binding protein [Chryseobacterium jejuense]SQB27162.1 L-rhamnose operon regulatory protein rhaS [Chryseobacterium jejuense]
MKRIVNFNSFNVFRIEKEIWDIEYHNHNFYELIIIENGKGSHHLNGITFPYQKGDVFLLRPSDAHEFTIQNKTSFIYIKFTEEYIWENLLMNKNNELQKILRLLMEDRSFVYESVIKSKTDRAHLLQLSRILLHEFSHKNLYNKEIAADLFSTIFTILTRNTMSNATNQKWVSKNLSRIDRILYYINVNFLDADKMKIENLAKEFLLSPNYISIYIKKETGFSIQQHIIQYKVKAAEKLLLQSNYNISEIADRLGFNDVSHFNKIFKTYRGKSPSVFKKENKTT